MGFRTVYVQSHARLGYEQNSLTVRTADMFKKISFEEINTLVVVSQQTVLTAVLLAKLSEHNITVIICNDKELPASLLLPINGCYNTAKRIREQLAWGEVVKKQLWRFTVQEKIKQQAQTLLAYGKDDDARILLALSKTVKSADSDNREAVAARRYFPALFGQGFNRNQENTINACLNYGYQILLGMFCREIIAHGCLLQQGIHHRSVLNNYNFASDLMEPFRPLVDRIAKDLADGSFGTEQKQQLANIGAIEINYKDACKRLTSVVTEYVIDCIQVLDERKNIVDLEGYNLFKDTAHACSNR